MSQSYKSYPTFPQVSLPKEFDKSKLPIEEIIEKRRTIRDFSGHPLSIEEISKLLHFSYGITGSVPIPHLTTLLQYFRAAPSAGALYPLEIYLVAWNIKNMEPGIYHYHVLHHALECLEKGDFSDLAGEYTISKEITKKACVLFLISAIFQRTMFKYQERGYRFVLLDAGHVAQNLCLIATSMNLGVVLVGGFLDDELNRILKIDGVNETVVYPIIVGRAN